VLRRWFLDRRFKQDERRVLIRRLNDMQSPEYGGNGRKVSLAWAMLGYRGFSWLAVLQMVPPRRLPEQLPRDMDEIRDEVRLAKEIMPELRPDQEAKLARHVSALRIRYVTDYRQRIDRLGYMGTVDAGGHWWAFFKNLVRHFEDCGAEITPGWFNPDGRAVEYWLRGIGAVPARPEVQGRGLARIGL